MGRSAELGLALAMKPKRSLTIANFGTLQSARRTPRRFDRHFFAPALRFPSRAEQFLNLASAIIFWGSLGAPLGILIAYLAQLVVHSVKK
jgi:hypothetical protein